MKKLVLFSVLVSSAVLALVGCKSKQNEPGGGGSCSGKSNGHDYVDLGLSVKWATCNVGAESPEEYGNYYAWGEIAPKVTNYDCSTYYDTNDGYNNNGGKTILDLEDDAAYVNWGGCWRMPTMAECQELLDNCTWTWTKLNGIKGYKVTSKKEGYKDMFIFLPAAGGRYEDDFYNVGSCGNYWSSSLLEYESYNAWGLLFCDLFDDYGLNSDGARCIGQSVRPVLP